VSADGEARLSSMADLAALLPSVDTLLPYACPESELLRLVHELAPGQEAGIAALEAQAAARPTQRPLTYGGGGRLGDPGLWRAPRRLGPPKRLRPAVRCTAHRRDGRPCRAWAIHGGTVCWAHGGAAPQVRRAALARLEGAAVAAYAYRAADMIAAARAADQAEAATLLGRVLEEGRQAPWPRRRNTPPVRCRWLFDDGRACGAWAVRGGYLCRSHGGTPVARHPL
jgi:hypothetical protein